MPFYAHDSITSMCKQLHREEGEIGKLAFVTTWPTKIRALVNMPRSTAAVLDGVSNASHVQARFQLLARLRLRGYKTTSRNGVDAVNFTAPLGHPRSLKRYGFPIPSHALYGSLRWSSPLLNLFQVWLKLNTRECDLMRKL